MQNRTNWQLRNEFLDRTLGEMQNPHESAGDLLALGWDQAMEATAFEIDEYQVKLALAYEMLNQQKEMLEEAAEQMASIIREVQGRENN